ncbi:MAG: hypothetical protein HY246_03740 [Proteobacteria bacterium]|nr:hypothetical protein [Pseudomonadota bacterium]
MRASPASAAGFTLFELIIAVALSAAVIVLGVQLYQTVVRAGDAMARGQRDWSAEQFVRGQLLAADRELNQRFKTVLADDGQLSFVTRKSAQFGEDSPPVLATYTVSSGTAIRYSEIALPPWWDDGVRSSIVGDRLRDLDRPNAWKGQLLADMSTASFSYWDNERQRWVDRWSNKENLPVLVRLEIRKFGETRQFVMETKALSFSLSSGS